MLLKIFLYRGSVNDWYEILSNYAKYSIKTRKWLINYLLIDNSAVIPQYYLDCPSNEVNLKTHWKILFISNN